MINFYGIFDNKKLKNVTLHYMNFISKINSYKIWCGILNDTSGDFGGTKINRRFNWNYRNECFFMEEDKFIIKVEQNDSTVENYIKEMKIYSQQNP